MPNNAAATAPATMPTTIGQPTMTTRMVET
jgi:hypothetical protein